MRKLLFFILLFVLLSMGLKAQPYGNEWINHSQKYYKIKIAQNGVYRINYTTLLNAGIPVYSFDPRNFQIFNNGVEQKIFIQGEGDGIFDNGDFIEFYAEINTGSKELPLYVNTPFVPNPYYSLVNDTAVYFLTWNASFSNVRMLSETDVSFSSYSPNSFVFREEIQSYNGAYYAGETDQSGGTNARYVASEGYFDSQVFTLGTSVQKNISTTNLYAPGPYAKIESVVVGASQDFNELSQGQPDHHLRIEFRPSTSSSYTLFKDTLFKGYAVNKFTSVISPSSLGSLSTNFNFTSINNPSWVSNRTVISYLKVKYPHTFNFENRSDYLFYLPDATTQAKSYLQISNFAGSGAARLYNLTNGTRIDILNISGIYYSLVANTGVEKKCYITSDGYISNVSSLQPVTPTAQFTNYGAMGVDSAFVIVYNKKLLNTVTDYKNYRSTNVYGGMHKVVMADIDELYDQFAYGIVKNPLSVKGFIDYLLDYYPTPPKELFLVGKSIHLNLCRQNSTNYANCLVPSFGNPSSDALFSVGLNGTANEPAIATGRLAAQSNTDVTVYLNKIEEYENLLNNPPAEWKKQILHFGGGKSSQEQQSFKSYLNNYKDTIEGFFYGGKVSSYFKTSSAPVQVNVSDEVKNHINSGVSLMTFFGHAAAGFGFDQTFDDMSNYNPLPGHYPFLLANGCYVGDIHGTTQSTSETYVLLPEKGVVGFIGTVTLGLPYPLNIYSQEWYSQLARKSYGKSVGTIMQQTIKALAPIAVNDAYVSEVCYEMSLHGDPSLKINAEPKPDYAISYNNVFFDTKKNPDSVTVYVVRTNVGKATRDDIFTELIRTLPNGATQTYLKRNPAPKFKDTISFTFFMDVNTDLGINKVKVTLDAYHEVDELNENDNSTGEVELIIYGTGLNPIYPYQFAIIPTDTITLKASTVNPFEQVLNYVFQIDTTDTYNSPFMQISFVSSPGGVVKWRPPITFTDSTVYYWRVSPDSVNSSDKHHWKESSFQYIKDKRGWSQAHFFQYKNDSYEYVQFNRPSRKFIFANNQELVQCHDFIANYSNYTAVASRISGHLLTYWHCNQFNPSISVVVFNPTDASNLQTAVISNPASSANNGTYGECICRDYPQNTFEFLVSTPTQQSYLTNFLNNSSVIPNGYYVLAYSMNSVNYSTFSNSLMQAFESIGSAQIRNISNYLPYAIFGRKGDPIGSATETVAATPSDIIDLSATFTTNWKNGTISSPIIGPAKKWNTFHWRQATLDGPSTNDVISVGLIGIKADGSETTLATFPKDSIDVLDLGYYADATVYPTIRLVATMSDTTLQTPPQMKRWQVIFEPVPEGALNPQNGFYLSNDTIQEGDKITIRLPFQNVSDIPFSDSLLYTYWLEDYNNIIIPLPSKLKKKMLMPNETVLDTLMINTLSYPGVHSVWAEVNPVNQPKSQLEQYHFNNICFIPVVIINDHINPLMDVTFDGIHILNNDLVSAKPNILVSLKDENKFLALNDTNDFRVYLQPPLSGKAKPVYFNKEMTFTPAVLPNNSAKINYNPILSTDGSYQLLVQAKDRSDNQSGTVDYKINFKVINKSTITEVMNYPNPFSTATHFVFTLTGSEIPTYFKIQVLNISGKVVREITQHEIGDIHVGRNITQYAWDGKDEFGDQLANGVYLYRVVTSINGHTIEHQSTDADQYFKKDFGKMYLMR